jgi:hypothetical protein
MSDVYATREFVIPSPVEVQILKSFRMVDSICYGAVSCWHLTPSRADQSSFIVPSSTE